VFVVVSGVIYDSSGIYGAMFFSGEGVGVGVISGVENGTYLVKQQVYSSGGKRRICFRCYYDLYFGRESVTITDSSGLVADYCYSCAGFDYHKGGFVQKEEWIRDSLPSWCSGMDNYAMADYLEEQNRSADAYYIRSFQQRFESQQQQGSGDSIISGCGSFLNPLKSRQIVSRFSNITQYQID
jgi:hypothetical protein